MIERSECFLPADKQFSYFASELEEYICDELDAKSAMQDGEILDFDTEFGCDFAKFYEMCGYLARLDQGDSEEAQLQEWRDALYRGMVFGMWLADTVGESTVQTLPISEYFLHLHNSGSMDSMHEDIGVYLGERQVVDGLIGRYMPEIDPTGRNAHMAELGAGLVLMLCERVQGAQYVATTAHLLQPSDFE